MLTFLRLFLKREGEFILDVDAPNIGIGTVLSQKQEGKELLCYTTETFGDCRYYVSIKLFCSYFIDKITKIDN